MAPPGHSIFLVIYAIFTRTIQLGTWDGYVSIYNPYIVKLFRRVVVTRPMMLPRSNNVQARQILYARRAGWLDGEAGSVFPELDSPDGTVKYKSASQAPEFGEWKLEEPVINLTIQRPLPRAIHLY